MSIDFAHFITHFSSAAHKKIPVVSSQPIPLTELSYLRILSKFLKGQKKIKSPDAAAANINV